MSKTFYSSDQHFGHTNILTYCPGRLVIANNVDDMDAVLIGRWNSVVVPEDTVYVLGDFAFKRGPELQAYVRALNGTKILIKGNHDRESAKKYLEAGFDRVCRSHEFMADTGGYYLVHKPQDAPEMYPGIILCGHVHDRWQVQGRTINVGVDVWDFFPVTLDELLTVLP